MSTKTLRKRIALVAVSAMGFGLLTSVSANAAGAGTDVVEANVTLEATGGTQGICLTRTEAASKVSATPRYIAVGGKQNVKTDTNGTGTLTISGNATWSGVQSADTVSSSGKVLTMASLGDHVLTVNAAGPFSVLVEDGTGADLQTYYFIAVASCSTGYSASTSLAQINNAAADAATSNIDAAADLTVAWDASGVQKAWLDISLKDAYGVALDTTLTPIIATATGGCTINFTAAATTGTATAVVSGAGNETNDLVILGDNTPRSCRVVETYGAITIADKTVKFTGDAASVTVSVADSSVYWGAVDGSAGGATTNKDALAYVVKDSAGNVINHNAAPTISGGTNGFAQCTLADGSYGFADAVTNGIATVDAVCNNATVFGDGEFKLKVVRQSDGVAVYSDAIKATISKGIYTYSVSLDKPSYNIGDIITMTVTAKDSGGRLVRDYSALAGVDISVAGTTQTIAPNAADVFLNGVKKYKYIAGTTAAQYGYTVYLTSGSDQAAIVGNYTINNPSTGVTNAEVLSAIVKLIASINKQIAALQKALTKKK